MIALSGVKIAITNHPAALHSDDIPAPDGAIGLSEDCRTAKAKQGKPACWNHARSTPYCDGPSLAARERHGRNLAAAIWHERADGDAGLQ